MIKARKGYEKIFTWNIILYGCEKWTFKKKKTEKVDLEKCYKDQLDPTNAKFQGF